MTAQDYVDAEIRHHEAQLDAKAGTVEALTVHVRAILQLRAIAATQYRPRLFVPARLQPPLWHQDALRSFATALGDGVIMQIPTEPRSDRAVPSLMWDTDDPDPSIPRPRTSDPDTETPFRDTRAPATSPIYAQVRDRFGFGVPSRR